MSMTATASVKHGNATKLEDDAEHYVSNSKNNNKSSSDNNIRRISIPSTMSLTNNTSGNGTTKPNQQNNNMTSRSKYGKLASLIVVAGIVPGFICLFVLCLKCPDVLDKVLNKAV